MILSDLENESMTLSGKPFDHPDLGLSRQF
jgi:hypothetical protein